MIQNYLKKLGLLGLVAGGAFLTPTEASAQTACSDLFFSEYIEGSSGTNKVLEIYNPTNAPIALSSYSVKLYANGASAATATLPLTGTLAANDVLVIANSASAAGIISAADIQVGSANAATNVANFNGDDAVSLVKMVGTNEVFVDIIGNIGCDPGSDWNNGVTPVTLSTANRTLRRKPTINTGITVDPAGTTAPTPNNTDCPFPTITSEWNDFIDTDYTNLGSHTSNCNTSTGPVISFAASTSSVLETVTGGTFNVPVTIINPSATTATTVTVAVAPAGGTATSGADYTFTTATLTFPAGSSANQNAVITIIDDALIEGDETINLILSSPTTGSTLGTATHTVTIIDSEIAPVITFGTPASVTVQENAGTVNIPVSLSTSSTLTTTVQVVIGTPAGTATSGTDFTFASQTLTFAPGTTTQNATLTIINDKAIEGNETVNFTLQAANGGTIGSGNAYTVTIISEDLIPTYTVAQISNNNVTTGQPDSLGVKVKLIGTIYGVNQRTTGLQLTLIDATGGVGLFTTSAAVVPAVAPIEGDRVRAIGTVAHFNGLTQLTLDSIVVLANNQTLVTPTLVTGPLTEAHESELIKIANPVTLVTPSQWPTTAVAADVDVTDGTNTYKLRAVPSANLHTIPAPTGPFMLTGIGGQFDQTDPRDSGYQILPRRLADIQTISGASEDLANAISIYPNPASQTLKLKGLESKKATVSIINALGQVVANVPANASEINVSSFPAGVYTLRIAASDALVTKRFVKIN